MADEEREEEEGEAMTPYRVEVKAPPGWRIVKRGRVKKGDYYLECRYGNPFWRITGEGYVDFPVWDRFAVIRRVKA